MFNVTGKGISIKDTELRYSKGGTAVAKNTLVNKEEYNGVETSHFTDIVLFGEKAEQFAQEVDKGCLVNLTSAILKHPVNKTENKTYYNTEVVVFDYIMEKKFESKKK